MKYCKTFFRILFLVTLISSCKDEQAPSPYADLDPYEIEVIEYFYNTALGYGIGNATNVTRKWVDTMILRVEGPTDSFLINELDLVIDTLNSLFSDGMHILRSNNSFGSKAMIYFGEWEWFEDRYGSTYTSHFDYFNGYVSVKFNRYNELSRAYIYVDGFNTTRDEQRHIIREELTQSLGLGRDSRYYEESIFHHTAHPTSFAEIDKQLVRLLYDPRMKAGLSKKQVEPILLEIIGE